MSSPVVRRISVAGAAVVLAAVVVGPVEARGTAADAASHAPAVQAGSRLRAAPKLVRRGRIDVATLPRNSHRGGRAAPHPELRRLPDRFSSRATPSPATPQTRVAGPLDTTPGSPVQATITSAPNDVLTGFQGVDASAAPESTIDPPDPFVAVGPDHIMQAVNLTMRITQRTEPADSDPVYPVDVPLLDFFGVPNDIPYFDSDPRVIFDSAHQRWIASEVSWDCTPGGLDDATFGHGYLDFAFSETADPLGAWDAWFAWYADALPDYPGLGTSLDKVVQSDNLYEMQAESGPGDCVSNVYDGADLLAYDWADIVENDNDLIPDGQFFPDLFTIRPAVQAPATSNTAQWLAYGDDGSGGLTWVKGTVTGTVSPSDASTFKVSSAATALADPPVEPPPPHQPNGIVTTAIDSRLTDAVQQGNEVFAVSTNGCTPTGDSSVRDCVRVTQFDVSANTKPQDFLIVSNGADVYMGGIGIAGNGTLHMVWTRSATSAGSFPSSFTAYQRPSDPANSRSAARTLAAGAADHGDGSGDARWGDYVGVAQDPQVPDAVWQANEYASADGRWATYVSQLQTPGLRYVPITPARLVDTRTGLGISSSLKAKAARTFQVTGRAGIPSKALAITGNATVTNQTANGFVAVTPVATNTPPSSTVNFPKGDVRANNLTAALGAGGKLAAVYVATSGSSAQFVFDVTGYYVDDSTKGGFTPTEAGRFLDSRVNVGTTGSFKGFTPKRVGIGGRTIGSTTVPNTAIAITANLTVTGQTKKGFLAVQPSNPGSGTPTTSTLNFPLGDNRANGLTVPLDTNATSRGVWIDYIPGGGTSADHADVLLDVTGYYTNDATKLTFHPLNPGRIMDTRSGKLLTGLKNKFLANTARTLNTDGHWGVPAGASGITGNLTVVNQTHKGFVAVTRDPDNTPATSTINFPVGDIRANGFTSALSTTGNVSMTYVSTVSGTGTDLILDLSGYFK